MEINCGRRTFTLTEKDIILCNGACYKLTTQTYHQNWNDIHPTIAKAKASKMIKDGTLKEMKKEGYMTYYKLNKEDK